MRLKSLPGKCTSQGEPNSPCRPARREPGPAAQYTSTRCDTSESRGTAGSAGRTKGPGYLQTSRIPEVGCSSRTAGDTPAGRKIQYTRGPRGKGWSSFSHDH